MFSLGPGKTDVNILWAGSDDGVIQITRDGGKTWTHVTPKEMPDFGRVSQIDASAFDAGAAYVAVKKPLLDDMAPYVFRTHDYGRTWTKIVNGIRPNDYVHAVREDRTRKGLLYAGTQHGFYVSFNDGDQWQSLSLNLPDTQVSDIAVEANDIAIATHGRGFYILDNIAAIRQAGPAVTSTSDFYLFAPGDAIRSTGGATITYLLKKPAQNLALDILDSKGELVRSIPGAAPGAGRGGREGRGGRGGAAAEAGTAGAEAVQEEGGGGGRGRGGSPTASLAAGLNRFTWDLQYAPATTFPGARCRKGPS